MIAFTLVLMLLVPSRGAVELFGDKELNRMASLPDDRAESKLFQYHAVNRDPLFRDATPISELIGEAFVSQLAKMVGGRDQARTFVAQLQEDSDGNMRLSMVGKDANGERVRFVMSPQSGLVAIQEDDPGDKMRLNEKYKLVTAASMKNQRHKITMDEIEALDEGSDEATVSGFDPHLWDDLVGGRRRKRQVKGEERQIEEKDERDFSKLDSDVYETPKNGENSNPQPVSVLDEPKAPKHSRFSRDLIYERMKMRTGNGESRDPSKVTPVGGGVLEKRIKDALTLGENQDSAGEASGTSRMGSGEHGQIDELQRLVVGDTIRSESREMQCCNDLEVISVDGVLGCHPYVLGRYRKIGGCGGRSFYQHANNTDIFLYHACGAWYFGLEIGSCGGWILAKSLDLCASSTHLTVWQFFNEGKMLEDKTFKVVERCQLYNDFRPLPTVNNPSLILGFNRPVYNYPHQPVYREPPTTQPPLVEEDRTEPIKHEHIHYHINVDEGREKYAQKDQESKRQHSHRYKPVTSGTSSLGAGFTSLKENHFEFPRPFEQLLPGGHSVSFQISEEEVGPEVPLHVKQVYEDPAGLSAESIDKYVQQPGRQHIMINNFHIPTTTTTVTPSTRPRTRTSSTSTTTTTTTEKPYRPVLVVQRPNSDLQLHRPPPMSLRDKINRDLITLKYAVNDGVSGTFQQRPEQQNTPLVGYIIKKRPNSSQQNRDLPSLSPYVHYGNARHQMDDEKSSQESQFYFPVKKRRKVEKKAPEVDKNSRKLL